MVYLGAKASFSINMNKLAAGNPVKAFWINPSSGAKASIEAPARTGVQAFSTPPGWEDALLILEASR